MTTIQRNTSTSILVSPKLAEQLSDAVELLSDINADLQIILTVSPVALLATMEERHVLQATTYSKSVLRVAAEEAVRRFGNVHYFASYEIITATCNTQEFIASDRRTITAAGVARVMDCFFEFYAGEETGRGDSRSPQAQETVADGAAVTNVCDEEAFFREMGSYVSTNAKRS